MNRKDLERVKVSVNNGLLMQRGKPMSTKGQNAEFVMNGEGNLYVDAGRGHQAFLGSRPVAAAGEMQVNNGKLVEINNQSGHYQPPPAFVQQTVAHLQSQGVQVPASAQNFMQVPDLRTRAYPTADGWTTAVRTEDYDSAKQEEHFWEDGEVLDIG
ncbi:hypothetical protein F3J20_26940 [Paraburkholderia sp. Cy-641]|uniref:hypothetical protein n=1 Tax=Paraburkholderia sp. Cy-641 TaxID=2608337 RepID=UPI001421C46F|nr:hypothetical protein [Paraburkholderia sp. Cy-641]NIF80973.1 hypothetical protein [Paraburkholderia sp. Cy-641]